MSEGILCFDLMGSTFNHETQILLYKIGIMFIVILITELIVCIIIFRKLNFPIALILLFLFFIFDVYLFKQFEELKKDYLDTITLFANITTTFLGVYCAVIFTNKETEKENKKKIAQLLVAAKSELHQSKTNLERMAKEARETYKDLNSSRFQKKIKKLKKSQTITTFRRPEIINFILQNELGLNYLPPDTIITLTSINSTISEVYDRVNHAQFNNLQLYISSIEHLVLANIILTEVLSCTISLIKKEITIEKWISDTRNVMTQSYYGKKSNYYKIS